MSLSSHVNPIYNPYLKEVDIPLDRCLLVSATAPNVNASNVREYFEAAGPVETVQAIDNVLTFQKFLVMFVTKRGAEKAFTGDFDDPKDLRARITVIPLGEVGTSELVERIVAFFKARQLPTGHQPEPRNAFQILGDVVSSAVSAVTHTVEAVPERLSEAVSAVEDTVSHAVSAVREEVHSALGERAGETDAQPEARAKQAENENTPLNRPGYVPSLDQAGGPQLGAAPSLIPETGSDNDRVTVSAEAAAAALQPSFVRVPERPETYESMSAVVVETVTYTAVPASALSPRLAAEAVEAAAPATSELLEGARLPAEEAVDELMEQAARLDLSSAGLAAAGEQQLRSAQDSAGELLERAAAVEEEEELLVAATEESALRHEQTAEALQYRARQLEEYARTLMQQAELARLEAAAKAEDLRQRAALEEQIGEQVLHSGQEAYLAAGAEAAELKRKAAAAQSLAAAARAQEQRLKEQSERQIQELLERAKLQLEGGEAAAEAALLAEAEAHAEAERLRETAATVAAEAAERLLATAVVAEEVSSGIVQGMQAEVAALATAAAEAEVRAQEIVETGAAALSHIQQTRDVAEAKATALLERAAAAHQLAHAETPAPQEVPSPRRLVEANYPSVAAATAASAPLLEPTLDTFAATVPAAPREIPVSGPAEAAAPEEQEPLLADRPGEHVTFGGGAIAVPEEPAAAADARLLGFNAVQLDADDWAERERSAAVLAGRGVAEERPLRPSASEPFVGAAASGYAHKSSAAAAEPAAVGHKTRLVSALDAETSTESEEKANRIQG